MSKEILFSSECRQKMARGVDIIANAVKTTLGPCGRNVAFELRFGPPKITKDGVTVAQQIEVKDPFENMGVQMVKEVASKTADVAGDGTTTATILAQAIFREGNKFVTAGANPMELKRGIDKAVELIVSDIKARSKKVDSHKEIEQVATISANWDAQIGKHIAEAMEKVGRDGVITVEEARGTESSIEIVEGMQFDRGYLSPYFVTDQEKMEAVLTNPYVLLYDKKIIDMKQLLPLLDLIVNNGRTVLIVADDIDGNALAALVVNKLRGTLNVVAVRAPYFGDKRKQTMEDLAILTNASYITDELGMRLEDVKLEHLGTIEKVIVSKDNCSIINGGGNKETIKARAEGLKEQLKHATSSFDKERLQSRIAKMVGGVAIIRVGASTETEMKEKKDRIDDALSATRAAVEEGIVPGGGVALLNSLQCMPKKQETNMSADEYLGWQIIKKALEEPLRAICINAGYEASPIVTELKKINLSAIAHGPLSLDYGVTGYDAKTGHFVNMFNHGIIDPAKVVCCALQNAASIAGLMLTTECMIAMDHDEKKKDPFAPQPTHHSF